MNDTPPGTPEASESVPPTPVRGQVGAREVLRCVGRQIKILRRRTGLERAELGPAIGYSPSMVAAVELGRRPPQPEFLAAADSVLDAGGLLTCATDLVEQARAAGLAGVPGEPEWLAAWHAYAPATVPELLRTPDYHRAVLRAARPLLDEETVERRTAALAERAERVLGRRPAPLVTCVLDEAVLHRPYGGPAVLRAQLAHLAELGRLRHVEVQVMPTGAADHAGAEGGAFVLLEPADGRLPVARTGDGERVTVRRAEVRALEQRYAALRAQALSPDESSALVGKRAAEAGAGA
ncbi:transcriptional regulator [Streptomyces carminius]|uniref:Transcriptional regulator n=1 Tax=Streptomyces carminius TaxID=2665496 RepID=A0A2M8LYE0_9ACTN|nr:helix-turn-helix transcriptional regulator [Streptomyces carminius]PJE96988.1 transcriptional regulator [Streptomyces carminius]PJE97697.1 transcriptional regulator [Streptomyces carminius]